MMTKPTWKELTTAEKCEILQSVCQGDVMSASEMSAALVNKLSGPPPTRNAVIGIIDRHAPEGVRLHHKGYAVGPRKGRMKPQSLANLAKSPRRRRSATKAPSMSIVKPEPYIPPSLPAVRSLGLTLLELTEKTCKYATNDPGRGEQHLFCGHPTVEDSSYCAFHDEICHYSAGRVDMRGIAA